MSLTNRDVLEQDPSLQSLQNDGVSKVGNSAALAYELRTFVCTGMYEQGLDRILRTYLSHLDQPTQPSAWVSGFFGSGKSHLVKILDALWRNEIIDGQHARDIVRSLSDDVRTLLTELSAEAKRAGGVWSASGMLTASGPSDAPLSVRVLLLNIVHKAAGLSSDYGRARFRLWVRRQGWEEQIVRQLLDQGLNPEQEFDEYLVSLHLADAVWAASGKTDGDSTNMQLSWEKQFDRTDISLDDMESSLREVLKSKSSDGASIPLTLIVLDEVQQFLGNSPELSLALQAAVERMQMVFESRVLVVATGQAALQDTPNLQKLQGRFTVNVMLSDQDVEEVIREVVLKKKPSHVDDVKALISSVEGEIDRHLQSTKIGPVSADKAILVSDYPLLPTRRRFWARLLHKLDPSGTSGTLRTQLRVIHSAAVRVADQPLGTVIPADFVFDQLQSGLQQSGVLPRDIANLITAQEKDGGEWQLRARLIETIFLISLLPGIGDLNDAGTKATVDTLADLLVEDLSAGSDALRRQIPVELIALEEKGTLIRASDGGYAIQTGESLKWQETYRQQRSELTASQTRTGEIRTQTIEKLMSGVIGPLRKTHGVTKTPRSLVSRYGQTMPPEAPGESQVIAWVRDEWNSTATTVIGDARSAGDASAVIFVLVSKQSDEDLRKALIDFEASKRTLELRGASQDSGAGQQAADAMKNRMADSERRFNAILADSVRTARVYQGGGSEVDGNSFAEKLQFAFDSSLKRLFPRFNDGDSDQWGKVFDRAVSGNPDALKLVGYEGEPVANAVVSEVLKRTPGGQGMTWQAERKLFAASPFGWPPETVDGALAVLVNGGHIATKQDGKNIRGKEISKSKASSISFVAESSPVTPIELIAVRSIFRALDNLERDDAYVRNESANLVAHLVALARSAGGEPPAPLVPLPGYLVELQNESGNLLIKSLAAHQKTIVADIANWKTQAEKLRKRLAAWDLTMQLAKHADGWKTAEEITLQLNAIRDGRQILNDPDPLVKPSTDLEELLRTSLRNHMDRYEIGREEGVARLRASDAWQKLKPAEQAEILAGPGLEPTPQPSLSGQRDLLEALNRSSIAQWKVAIDALPKRLSDAELSIARKLHPETIQVSIDRPTFTRSTDVELWIEKTRQLLLEALASGHPVRIK